MRAYQIEMDRCKLCLTCMQECPYHAVELRGGAVFVEETRCVDCGLCAQVCRHGAVRWEDQTDAVKAMIAAHRKVVLALDPVCRALLPEGYTLGNLAAAALKLGFWDVADGSEAVAAVETQYARLLAEHHGDHLILTCCPVIRHMVEQHAPELADSLAPVASPMIALGRMIKRDFTSAAVVYVSACGAKSHEMRDVRHSTEINAVLTFGQLMAWLRVEGIALDGDEEPMLNDENAVGILSAMPGGLLEGLRHYAPDTDYQMASADGMDRCMAALELLKSGQLHGYVLELSACAGGCLGGVAGGLPLSRQLPAQLRLRAQAAQTETPPLALHRLALGNPAITRKVEPFRPDEGQISELLDRLGLGNPQDRADCGMCGYASCRARAEAILRGKENVNLCPHRVEEETRGLYQSVFSQLPVGVLLVDDAQKVVGMNQAARDMFALPLGQEKYIFELMDPEHFQYTLNTGISVLDRRVDVPEQYLTLKVDVVPLKDQGLVLGLLRDITDEEEAEAERLTARLQSVEIAQQLIDKQMNVAQQIAFLLGETTAETKVTLNQLKKRIIDGGETP